MTPSLTRLIEHACGHAVLHRIPGDGITRELHVDMLTISPCPSCAGSWAEQRRSGVRSGGS